MSEFEGVDVIVQLEGGNSSFRSYMTSREAQRIVDCGGLQSANAIHLRETPERIIPQSLKDGESCIADIFVNMTPNNTIYLN